MAAITNCENQDGPGMRRPTDNETQEIYRIYCKLATIIHDYAVGQQLYKNSCYSWAITANYYSLMHCGRFICQLGIKEYPKGHRELNEFLSGKPRGFQNNSFNTLLNNLRRINNNQEIENKIKVLGQKLKKIKELRENNSYDFFIISHQLNHSILKTEFPKAYEEIKRLNDEYLIFVFELFIAYINSLDYKYYFIGFLKDTNKKYSWAFMDLIDNLRIQKIDPLIIREISNLIDKNLMNKLDKGILLDDSFYNPITYDFYPDKNKKIQEFIERINNLIGE